MLPLENIPLSRMIHQERIQPALAPPRPRQAPVRPARVPLLARLVQAVLEAFFVQTR
jgi:hypothetical protein